MDVTDPLPPLVNRPPAQGAGDGRLRLPDGRIRLFYNPILPANPTGANPIVSAISSDGIHFVREGTVIDRFELSEPDGRPVQGARRFELQTALLAAIEDARSGAPPESDPYSGLGP